MTPDKVKRFAAHKRFEKAVKRSDNLELTAFPHDPSGAFKTVGQISSDLMEKLRRKQEADD